MKDKTSQNLLITAIILVMLYGCVMLGVSGLFLPSVVRSAQQVHSAVLALLSIGLFTAIGASGAVIITVAAEFLVLAWRDIPLENNHYQRFLADLLNQRKNSIRHRLLRAFLSRRLGPINLLLSIDRANRTPEEPEERDECLQPTPGDGHRRRPEGS